MQFEIQLTYRQDITKCQNNKEFQLQDHVIDNKPYQRITKG